MNQQDCFAARAVALYSAVVLACWCYSAAPVRGQTNSETESQQAAHFEKLIRPALIKYCYECHSTETDVGGGLSLDSRAGWQQGGDSGPALIAGQPGASRLLAAIQYEDPDLQMPPDQRLPPEVVRAFEKWIADGAYDPRREKEVAVVSEGQGSVAAKDSASYWSYQPLRRNLLPAPAAEPGTSPIDAFINQKLAAAGIAPAPAAARRNLVRRLFFDLTGLPPAAEELQQLVEAEDFQTAYLGLVERLLASPGYGETFARRWMDVARYAESVTLRGLVFQQAWRYRDYLIQAYAQDRPFNLMIREQIAGDLMHSEDLQERWLQLVATSFLAMGDTNFEKQDKQQLDMDYVDEQLDVIGQAFLGQTIGCARCHDHKFDPISTRDYYALAGILKSAVAMRHANVSNWIEQPLPLTPADEQRFADLEEQLRAVTTSLSEKKKLAAGLARELEQIAQQEGAQLSVGNAGQQETPSLGASQRLREGSGGESPDAAQKLQAKAQFLAGEVKLLEQSRAELQKQVDLRPRYLTVVEESPPDDIRVHIRGDVHNLGEVVPRGFLASIEVELASPIPEGSSGRLELADWIAADSHPLTARVYANRVWLWLMGQGLVETVNNFGTSGALPSHPELLDWLAAELIRSGWSTKHLVRTIVHSDAYRRAVVDPDQAVQRIDPDNRLYWRNQQRRLSAEEVRDAMLLASGELDVAWGGNLMKPGTKSDSRYQHASGRRTVYQPLFRNSLPEMLDAFDFAAPSLPIGDRARSTVVTQPLALLNDPWVIARAAAMAASITSEHSQVEPNVWIHSAFARCFQRSPTAGERELCLQFFEPQDPRLYPQQLERMVHTLFASIDFRYLR